jgi:acyl carrier protein
MIDSVIAIIKELIEEKNEVLNIEISSETNLRDLGLTSFDLATLTVKIEDEYDVDIFEDGLVSSVGEIVDILTKSK